MIFSSHPHPTRKLSDSVLFKTRGQFWRCYSKSSLWVNLGGPSAVVAVRVQLAVGTRVDSLQVELSEDGQTWKIIKFDRTERNGIVNLNFQEETTAVFVKITPYGSGSRYDPQQQLGLQWDVVHMMFPPASPEPESHQEEELTALQQELNQRPLVLHMVGGIGHGKSTCINTIATALSHEKRYIQCASVSTSPSLTESWTLSYRQFLFHNGQFFGGYDQAARSERVSLCIVDTPGIVGETHSQATVESLFSGLLAEGASGNPPIGGREHLIPKPDAVVLVVGAATLDCVKSNTVFLRVAATLQIPLIILLTKIDKIDPDCLSHPERIYTSGAVATEIFNVACQYGVGREYILPMLKMTSSSAFAFNSAAVEIVRAMTRIRK